MVRTMGRRCRARPYDQGADGPRGSGAVAREADRRVRPTAATGPVGRVRQQADRAAAVAHRRADRASARAPPRPHRRDRRDGSRLGVLPGYAGGGAGRLAHAEFRRLLPGDETLLRFAAYPDRPGVTLLAPGAAPTRYAVSAASTAWASGMASSTSFSCRSRRPARTTLRLPEGQDQEHR